MATDMKLRIMSIDDEPSPSNEPSQPLSQSKKWPIYVEEIQFHIAIIE